MTRDEILTLLAGRDPIAAAAALEPPESVTWTHDAHPDDWLVDDGGEGPLEDHRRAHLTGRPSEAIVRYGAGSTDEGIADRITALAELTSETGLLRSVHLLPGPDSTERPGSWGAEDLLVAAVTRQALPGVAIRVDWERLGASASQVAAAFGATDWMIPVGDDADPEHLAEALGARAVAR